MPTRNYFESARLTHDDMSHPSPGLNELARNIVAHESGGESDSGAAAAAIEVACERLNHELVDMLGTGGLSALFTRALRLAQREHPVLAEVGISGEPAPSFSDLSRSLATKTDEEASAAATGILAHAIGLLVMLVGEELGLQPIRKLWPHTTSVREIDQ